MLFDRLLERANRDEFTYEISVGGARSLPLNQQEFLTARIWMISREWDYRLMSN